MQTVSVVLPEPRWREALDSARRRGSWRGARMGPRAAPRRREGTGLAPLQPEPTEQRAGRGCRLPYRISCGCHQQREPSVERPRRPLALRGCGRVSEGKATRPCRARLASPAPPIAANFPLCPLPRIPFPARHFYQKRIPICSAPGSAAVAFPADEPPWCALSISQPCNWVDAGLE